MSIKTYIKFKKTVLQKLKWHLKNDTTDQECEVFKCPS